MPITWQNIDIGDNRSPNMLINTGGNQLTEGISKLADVVAGINQVGAANFDARTKVNTEDAVATLAGITDSKALATAMASGGALNKDTVRGKYGAEVDMNKVSSIMAAKQADLAKQDTDAKIRGENLAIGERDRLDRNRQHQDQLALSKNAQAMHHKQLQLTLDDRARSLATDEEGKRLYETVLNIYKTQPNAAKAEAEKQQLLTNLGTSGFKLVDPAKAGSLANAASSTFTSGPMSQDYLDTVTAVNTNHTKKIADVDKGLDDFTKRFKKVNKVDDSIVQLMSDKSSTHGTSSVELAAAIYQGEKVAGSTETDNIGRQYTAVLGKFQDAGIEPTPAVIREVFKRSGWDDGNLVFDSDKYEIDNSVLRETIAKAKVADEFIQGDLGAALKLQQLKVLEGKAAINLGQQKIIQDLALKKYEQNKGSAVQGADFAIAPITIDTVKQLRYYDTDKKIPMLDPTTKQHLEMDEMTYQYINTLSELGNLNKSMDTDLAAQQKAIDEANLKKLKSGKAGSDALGAATFTQPALGAALGAASLLAR